MILGKYSGAYYEPEHQPKPQRKPHRKVVEPAKPLCERCGLDPVWALHRCGTCLRYYKKHGIERPYELIEIVRRRRQSARWCKNCGKPEVRNLLRCAACYKYWRINRKERPQSFWVEECMTCGFPKQAAPLTKDGCRKFHSGRCSPCYRYYKKYRRERPKELWGAGKFGFCECGYSAEHQVDGFNLCNRCVKDY